MNEVDTSITYTESCFIKQEVEDELENQQIFIDEPCFIKSEIDIEDTLYERTPHQCPECDYTTDFFASFQVHLDTQHASKRNLIDQGKKRKPEKKKSFGCNTCQRTFVSVSQLKAHMRTHTGEKPFQCDICHKTFAILGNLKCHMATHTGEKPFQCKICQKSFARLFNLQCHLRTHTDEKPYQCDMCEKSFAHLSNFVIHKRKHMGENPYECGMCQKKFLTLGHLKSHMKTHTGKRPHQCGVCQKSYSQMAQLNFHMRKNHPTENQCQNDVPGKVSKPSNQLKPRKTHPEKELHRCDVCQRTFVLNGHLRAHMMKIHNKEMCSPEMSYQCDNCQKTFVGKSNLTRHQSTCVKSPLMEQSYKCDVCQVSFAQETSLKNHVKTHAVLRPLAPLPANTRTYIMYVLCVPPSLQASQSCNNTASAQS